MRGWGDSMRRSFVRGRVLGVCVGLVLLGGCTMTPEDKAFYGRGWINPDELDRDPMTQGISGPPDAGSGTGAVAARPAPASGGGQGAGMPTGGDSGWVRVQGN
jgi:hypothetical protein